MTNDRQLQKPRTSAANTAQDARAAEVTPHATVAGVQGGNTTGALAPSSRQISVFKGEHQHLLIVHLDYKGLTADLASTQSSGTS